MTVNLKVIGEFLEFVRQAKHISRQQVASDLGWSDKTLQRIAYGQVDMKVSQYITLLSYFAVEANEITDLTDNSLAICDLVDERVIKAGATGDAKALTQLETNLTAAYATHHMPWIRSEVLTCQLMRAELAHDTAAAKRIALQLFRRYLQYDWLTAFDFRIVSRVVSYVPFAELQRIFPRQRLAKRTFGWSNLDDQADSVLDCFYIGLLDSAIDSGQVAYVREACTLIGERVVLWSNYYFRMYKRLAVAITMLLDGREDEALQVKTELLAGVAAFIPEEIFCHDRQGVEQLWTSVSQLIHPSDE